MGSAKSLGGLALLLTACLSCTTSLDVYEAEGPFPGLRQRLELAAGAGGELRVLVVHGMGSPEAGYCDSFVSRIARRMRLKRETEVRPTQTLENNPATLREVRYRDSDGCRRMVIYELHWAPITDGIKEAYLSFDRRSFAADHREVFNAEFKDELITDSLSDPIIYLGPLKQRIQDAATWGLSRVLTRNPADQTCLITHSLGSVIVFDTLLDRFSRGGLPNPTPVLFFMLANQLALLDLARPDFALEPTVACDHQDHALQTGQPGLLIVALCDPNDLLTYSIPPGLECRYARLSNIRMSVTNVSLSVAETSLLGLLANPVTAHSGFWSHDRTIKVLTTGDPGEPDPSDG